MNWRFDNRTLGDGNCFYRAVEQQLCRPELAKWLNPAHCQLSHIQLRKEICDFMMSSLPPDNQPNNWLSSRMGQFLKEIEEIDMSTDRRYWRFTRIRDFLSDQKRDRVWANQIMIQGAACYLGIGIRIASRSNRIEDPVTYIKTGLDMDEETTETLCLGMNEHVHFQSFIPI